ncbi:MAG: glycine cleavage system aminomethyltransferase GcvT [Bacteroidales bacterium]|nr:glycine cleavage system aminomethyltransferase GcvT [Bacteroidales bacterium]
MSKKTVFFEIHRLAGGRMIEFAGFEMPVEYSGINTEHINVREKAGIFDVSHMGEIWVKGPKARDFVQKVTSNDVDKLEPGKIQYSCFPNRAGGIVDDLLVYHYEKEKYLLVVNASNTEKDWNWLVENNTENAELENASDKISQLAVQGPDAAKILQKLTDTDLSGIPYYSFAVGKMAGADEVIISHTGYTGAGGFELYFYNEHGPQLWEAIMKAGKDYGIAPAGLAARDTLRLEMGFCLYGNDITDGTSPLEAGLGWITKFTDNNFFIARDILEKQKEEGVTRRLIGFEMIEKGIPRQHYEVLSLHGEWIGEVTSGTMSPMLKKGIGMAYVKKAFATEGTIFNIRVRNKDIRAQVVSLPFYNKLK